MMAKDFDATLGLRRDNRQREQRADDLWGDFTIDPWRFVRRGGEPGRALFAECLRLGREGR
jgi:hypothetical protein